MRDSFDTASYLRALAQAWKRALACVAAAAAIALAAGLLTTPQYEANVLVLIQLPPAAQAFPTAMNPAYFEYLRGFEQSLTADGLLSRLLRESKLDQAPRSLSPAAFRNSVGRAVLLKNTRMVKLSVVLPDPQAAHDVAVLWARLAEQTTARLGTAEIDATRKRIAQELARARQRMEAAAAEIEKLQPPARLRRQVLERDYKDASAAVEMLSARASEAAIMSPRYESLEIADTGAVPDRPIRPRIVLNVVVGAMLALLGSLFYETWRFQLRPRVLAAAVPAPLPRERIAVR